LTLRYHLFQAINRGGMTGKREGQRISLTLHLVVQKLGTVMTMGKGTPFWGQRIGAPHSREAAAFPKRNLQKEENS